jgi:hypothetical protein
VKFYFDILQPFSHHLQIYFFNVANAGFNSHHCLFVFRWGHAAYVHCVAASNSVKFYFDILQLTHAIYRYIFFAQLTSRSNFQWWFWLQLLFSWCLFCTLYFLFAATVCQGAGPPLSNCRCTSFYLFYELYVKYISSLFRKNGRQMMWFSGHVIAV